MTVIELFQYIPQLTLLDKFLLFSIVLAPMVLLMLVIARKPDITDADLMQYIHFKESINKEMRKVDKSKFKNGDRRIWKERILGDAYQTLKKETGCLSTFSDMSKYEKKSWLFLIQQMNTYAV